MSTETAHISCKYQKGDYIVHKRNGVCLIEDIITEKLIGKQLNEYYVLSSVYDKNTKIFIPIGSQLEEGLERVPSREEVNGYIEESKTIEIEWLSNGKERAKQFDKIVKDGNRAEILWLIKTIREYRDKLDRFNKKMKSNDQRYLTMSENMIMGEFAFALGINRSDVFEYIENARNK